MTKVVAFLTEYFSLFSSKLDTFMSTSSNKTKTPAPTKKFYINAYGPSNKNFFNC